MERMQAELKIFFQGESQKIRKISEKLEFWIFFYKHNTRHTL